jgi:hypothetical protein
MLCAIRSYNQGESFHCNYEPDVSINNPVLITLDMLWHCGPRLSCISLDIHYDLPDPSLLPYSIGNPDSDLPPGNSSRFPRCLRWAFLCDLQYGHTDNTDWSDALSEICEHNSTSVNRNNLWKLATNSVAFSTQANYTD